MRSLFDAPESERPVLAARFLDKIEPEPNSGCWLWAGTLVEPSGYGVFAVKRKSVQAHRVSYEIHVGPIPEGLQLDHLCRVRCCVNPAHLEPVTHRENGLRGVGICAGFARRTHCLNGHELIEGNLVRIRNRATARHCKTCRYAANARYIATKAARSAEVAS